VLREEAPRDRLHALCQRGLTLANNALARVTAEFPGLRYGVDYVNLGYKDGSAAVMRGLDQDFAGPFPADTRGRPSRRFRSCAASKRPGREGGLFRRDGGHRGILDHPDASSERHAGHLGPTAVGAPKYYAYLNAGQLVGMVAGMKGAAEYEKLLAADHPELAQLYRSTRGFTATKGMDAQTVIHFVIILFILIGNIAYLVTKRSGSIHA